MKKNDDLLKETALKIADALNMNAQEMKKEENRVFFLCGKKKLSTQDKLEHKINAAFYLFKNVYEDINNIDEKNKFVRLVMSKLSPNNRSFFKKALKGKVSNKIYNLEDFDFLFEKFFSSQNFEFLKNEKEIVFDDYFYINFLDNIMKFSSDKAEKSFYEDLINKEKIDPRYLPIQYLFTNKLIEKSYEVFSSVNKKEMKYNKVYFSQKKSFEKEKLFIFESFEDFQMSLRENYLKKITVKTNKSKTMKKKI